MAQSNDDNVRDCFNTLKRKGFPHHYNAQPNEENIDILVGRNDRCSKRLRHIYVRPFEVILEAAPIQVIQTAVIYPKLHGIFV